MVPMVSSLVKWVNEYHLMRWKYLGKNRLGTVGDGGVIKTPRPFTTKWYHMSLSRQTVLAAPLKKC